MTTDELRRAKELCEKRGDSASFTQRDGDDEYVLFPKLVAEVERLQGMAAGLKEAYTMALDEMDNEGRRCLYRKLRKRRKDD